MLVRRASVLPLVPIGLVEDVPCPRKQRRRHGIRSRVQGLRNGALGGRRQGDVEPLRQSRTTNHEPRRRMAQQGQWSVDPFPSKHLHSGRVVPEGAGRERSTPTSACEWWKTASKEDEVPRHRRPPRTAEAATIEH